MKKSIFDVAGPHPEPSDLTAFSRNALARDSEHRDETSLQKALAVEGTHILAFCDAKLVLKHDGAVLDPLFAPYELAELSPDFDNAVLLGFQPTGDLEHLFTRSGLTVEGIGGEVAVSVTVSVPVS